MSRIDLVGPVTDEPILYGRDIDADMNFSDRTRRNYVAAGILPRPDGNINGRDYWRVSTYRQFKADLHAGKFARDRRSSTPPRANGAVAAA